MDACVDPLVLQLEDEDALVRVSTLQKLRKVAAVENAHFPVRNPRRFLQCLRRRTLDENADVAREARRLVEDVMPTLGDGVEQILTSILPHLIPCLARAVAADDDGGSMVDDDVYRVFRKYVAVCNDLKAVVELLINIGLAHGRATVREASLISITKLLDERFKSKRKVNASSTSSITASKMGKALFVLLLQATVPMLEDTDDGVIVAAEETIAKLQYYWGGTFDKEAYQFLSSEDNQALAQHHHSIDQFHAALQNASPPRTATSRPQSANGSMVPVSMVANRTSFNESPMSRSGHGSGKDAEFDGELLFGFVPLNVMDELANSRANTNADWKRRTAAVEQLHTLVGSADITSMQHQVHTMDPLFAQLVKLMQDIDPQIVKRSLQIVKQIVKALLPITIEKSNGPISHASTVSRFGDNGKNAEHFMISLVNPLVETAATLSDEKDLRTLIYTLLVEMFNSGQIRISLIEKALTKDALQSRRLQIREEALKVWSILLLLSQHSQAAKQVDEASIQVLGKLLGDTSVRVRDTAQETTAILAGVTNADIYTMVEESVDDQYIAERIDWASLRRRVRQKQLPPLAQLLPIATEASEIKESKSPQGLSELQKKVITASKTLSQGTTYVPDAPDLTSSIVCRGTNAVNEGGGSLSDRSYFSKPNAVDPTLCTTFRSNGFNGETNVNDDMADKLSALKKKASQLRRTTSVSHVAGDSNLLNSPRNCSDRYGEISAKPEQVSPTRSKTSPERLSINKRVETSSGEQQYNAPAKTARRRPVPESTKLSPAVDTENYHEQISPQKLQDIQTRAVNYEDQPIRSKFLDLDHSETESEPPASFNGDDRPIRPASNMPAMYSANDDEDNNNNESAAPRKKQSVAPAMSLATRKRLEAKQRQLETQLEDASKPLENGSALEIAEGNDTSNVQSRAARPISLATRKRLEAKSKQNGETSLSCDSVEDQIEAENVTRPTQGPTRKNGVQDRKEDSKLRPSALGSQEPRYLEQQELTPVANAKQEAATIVGKISRTDDWAVNFDALSITRRLAAHSPGVLEDKIHAVVAAILTQVLNLRSAVSKNALLALESMCSAFGRGMDGEVDAIVPLLLKRSADSNQFVCESASSALASVSRHCSSLRVVSALSTHLTSRAVPIRREVARCMLMLLQVAVERDSSSQQPALSAILVVVGKCLDDSNNEVRDAAKQALLFLLVDHQMDVARVKKLLPATGSAHSKLDQLVANKSSFSSSTMARPAKPASTASLAPAAAAKAPGGRAASSSGVRGGQAKPGGSLDAEAFEKLQTKLDSSNWKDRFDAIEELAGLAPSAAASWTSSGRVVSLFDTLIKRLDDGNAKVSALTLERLGGVLVPALGDGMASVLGPLLPALAKQLAASNGRMAALALDALRALGTHVDGRAMCQHLAPLAKLGNARVKPVLVDMLAHLATSDDKLQPALTR